MYYGKLVFLEQLAYLRESLISDELKKGSGGKKGEVFLIWTKRRRLFIFSHGRWLDEKTEQSGENIKYHVKIAIIKMSDMI